MTNPSAYDFSALDAVHKKYGDNCEKLKKQLAAKIKCLQKHGFCIDVVQHPGIIWQDMVNDVAEKAKAEARIDASTIDDLGTYTGLDGNKHQFIHFKPKGFKFTYVDFKSYRDVMHINNPIVYLNSFWGIYIENESLKMHDLVQYDIFKEFYKIAPYNLYDGGNDLLPRSDVYVQGICNHNGAIFDSWEEFIEANKRLNNLDLENIDNSIAKHQEDIKNLKSLRKKHIKDMKKTFAFLDSIVLEA